VRERATLPVAVTSLVQDAQLRLEQLPIHHRDPRLGPVGTPWKKSNEPEAVYTEPIAKIGEEGEQFRSSRELSSRIRTAEIANPLHVHNAWTAMVSSQSVFSKAEREREGDELKDRNGAPPIAADTSTRRRRKEGKRRRRSRSYASENGVFGFGFLRKNGTLSP